MEILPVLDLKGGQVVRAQGGNRANYLPIRTPLAGTSDPLDIAQGLLALHGFAALYVADLDAIEGRGDNRPAIERLRRTFPAVRLWVDNGIADERAARDWLGCNLGDLVLGSESQRSAAMVRSLADDERIVLSLDFSGDAFQGPHALLEASLHWPRRVIVMTLGRVGSAAGPDVATLAELRRAAPDRAYYAAGGVRDATDLEALSRAGAVGALVASALHDGRLGPADLQRFA